MHFQTCDVRNYSDQVALFKLALSRYGRIDHAIANAGVIEQGNWFDPDLSIETVEQAPTTLTLDVNLKGVLYLSRIAAVYLAYDKTTADDKSLTLVSSVAGFIESQGLFLYQASKHGVLGLLRTLRLYLPDFFKGVRVNAICPSLTLTGMVKDLKDEWINSGLAVNKPSDVANVIASVMAAGPGVAVGALRSEESDDEGRPTSLRGMRSYGNINWGQVEQEYGLNGRSLYVEGGRAWDIEERLDRTRPLWLGWSPNKRLAEAQTNLEHHGIRKRN